MYFGSPSNPQAPKSTRGNPSKGSTSNFVKSTNFADKRCRVSKFGDKNHRLYVPKRLCALLQLGSTRVAGTFYFRLKNPQLYNSYGGQSENFTITPHTINLLNDFRHLMWCFWMGAN